MGSFCAVLGLRVALSSFTVLSSSTALTPLTVGIGIALCGCILPCWINTRDLRRSLISAVTILLLSVPITTFIVLPAIYFLADKLTFPYRFLLSGSFGWSWFLVTIITAIEIATDRAWQQPRRRFLLLGNLVAVVITLLIEIATWQIAQTSSLSERRLWIHAPLIWITIVAAVNLKGVQEGVL